MDQKHTQTEQQRNHIEELKSKVERLERILTNVLTHEEKSNIEVESVNSKVKNISIQFSMRKEQKRENKILSES